MILFMSISIQTFKIYLVLEALLAKKEIITILAHPAVL